MINVNCFDTYALMEIYKGNPQFSFLMNEPFVIPDLTMAEFYKVLLRERDETTADNWMKQFVFYCRQVNLDILIKAIRFQQDNKKKNFSLFDAVGYVFAAENKCDFVTGDIAFREMPGVLFVK